METRVQKKGAGPKWAGSRVSWGSAFLEREIFRAFGIGGHVLEGGSRSLLPGSGLRRGLRLRGGLLGRGGGLGAGGRDLPDLEIVVPAAVVLAALEVDWTLSCPQAVKQALAVKLPSGYSRMNSCLAQGPRAEFPDWTGSFWARVPSISSAIS